MLRLTMRRMAAAAVFGLVGFTGSAIGQQPQQPQQTQTPRLVVQASGGEPGVFVVNGQAPPGTALPGTGVCATGPGGGASCATGAYGVADGCSVGGGRSGLFGNGPRVGPYAFNGVTFGECLSFYWRNCKDPATVPPPIGGNLKGTNAIMMGNALAEYFVVYREDWLAGTANLNESGERHLDGIVKRFNLISAPMKIEPSGNPELDTMRKVMMIDLLTKTGLSGQDAYSRVVVGVTRAEGLRQDSIPALYGRGNTIYSGAQGSGGFGGGGFGGIGVGGIAFPAYGGIGR